VPALSPEHVWFACLSRALGALPLADAERVRVVSRDPGRVGDGRGSRGPTAPILWDELAAYVGVGACPWSPDDGG
jgi:hypothetical protein